MLYCSSVWSNTSTTNIKKLQLVQNFACKIVTKTRKFLQTVISFDIISDINVNSH